MTPDSSKAATAPITSTAGELDRRVGQLVEAAAHRDLTVRRRRLDGGDRCCRVEAARDQLGGDRRPLGDPHQHDHRAADPGEGRASRRRARRPGGGR